MLEMEEIFHRLIDRRHPEMRADETEEMHEGAHEWFQKIERLLATNGRKGTASATSRSAAQSENPTKTSSRTTSKSS